MNWYVVKPFLLRMGIGPGEYGRCKLAWVFLLHVGFEVSNGCSMGVYVGILECRKGWVCTICTEGRYRSG